MPVNIKLPTHGLERLWMCDHNPLLARLDDLPRISGYGSSQKKASHRIFDVNHYSRYIEGCFSMKIRWARTFPPPLAHRSSIDEPLYLLLQTATLPKTKKRDSPFVLDPIFVNVSDKCKVQSSLSCPNPQEYGLSETQSVGYSRGHIIGLQTPRPIKVRWLWPLEDKIAGYCTRRIDEYNLKSRGSNHHRTWACFQKFDTTSVYGNLHRW